MVETDNKHYSEKGGHKERSDFWKKARKMEQQGSYDPTRYVAALYRLGFDANANYMGRRMMRRVTSSGRS